MSENTFRHIFLRKLSPERNFSKSCKECMVYLIMWVLGRSVIQYKNRESLGTGKVFEENSLIRKKVEYLFSISCFSKVNYFFHNWIFENI